jgi:hypothetical protein
MVVEALTFRMDKTTPQNISYNGFEVLTLSD